MSVYNPDAQWLWLNEQTNEFFLEKESEENYRNPNLKKVNFEKHGWHQDDWTWLMALDEEMFQYGDYRVVSLIIEKLLIWFVRPTANFYTEKDFPEKLTDISCYVDFKLTRGIWEFFDELPADDIPTETIRFSLHSTAIAAGVRILAKNEKAKQVIFGVYSLVSAYYRKIKA